MILGRKQALNFTFDSVTASFPIGKKWLPLPSPAKVSNARSSQPNTTILFSGFSNSNIQRYLARSRMQRRGRDRTRLVVGAVYVIEYCSCPVPHHVKCWKNQSQWARLSITFTLFTLTDVCPD